MVDKVAEAGPPGQRRRIFFVHDALSAGRSRTEIRQALAGAGWSEGEIGRALAGYVETDFTPPVPRPSPQLTARDVFLYAILFSALAITASHLVTLILAILDLQLPAPGDEVWREMLARNQARWSIAALVVSAPVYAWLTVRTGREIARDPSQRRSLVRKWLTYLALFVSALIFCGDAVWVIYSFLKGEATLRFLLKAVTVAVVTGGIFGFYLRDFEDIQDAR